MTPYARLPDRLGLPAGSVGRNRRTRRIRRAALCVAFLFALAAAGCAKGQADAVVRADGSLDVKAAIAVPASRESAVGPALDGLAERLRAAGFDAEYARDGADAVWRIARHYTRDELRRAPAADELQLDEDGYRLRFKREKRLLYDRLVLEGALQPNELLAADGHPLLEQYRRLPAFVRRLAERQVDLRMTLTLPIPPASHNGEASNFGRTIAWRVSPTAETPVRLTVFVPNAGTYVAAGLLLALAAAGIALRVRRRRRRT